MLKSQVVISFHPPAKVEIPTPAFFIKIPMGGKRLKY
jgi:hypothetical protein